MTLFVFRGIPIQMHWSFLLVGGLYVLVQLASAGLAAATSALIIGLIVFGSVLLHELGHALAARGFGIPTRDITLYPFGGIASIAREPANATQELVVAIAGPAVNAVLAAGGVVAWYLGLPGAGVFAIINAGMGLFNLLPAYPMDGGRVLRAAWTPRLGKVNATLRSLGIARWFAWAFIAMGLFTTPSLLLVGGFLLFANRAERARWAALARQTARLAREPFDARPIPARVRHTGRWSHPIA